MDDRNIGTEIRDPDLFSIADTVVRRFLSKKMVRIAGLEPVFCPSSCSLINVLLCSLPHIDVANTDLQIKAFFAITSN